MSPIFSPKFVKRSIRIAGIAFILIGGIVAAVGFTRQDCEGLQLEVSAICFSLVFWGILLLLSGVIPACDAWIESLLLVNSDDENDNDIDVDDFD